MKKGLLQCISIVLLSLCSSQAYAGFCGGGKVIEIVEGGWNTDDLLIKIDYSDTDTTTQHPNYRGYIRFLNDPSQLPTERLESIRRLALTALVSGKSVVAFSHNNSCRNATQLALFSIK